MIQVQNISYEVLGRKLLRNVSFSTTDKSRIGFVGANGLGKSTLLRIIMGELSPQTGMVSVNKGACIGYLPQQVPDSLKELPLRDFLFEGTSLRDSWKTIQIFEQGGEVSEGAYSVAVERFLEGRGYDTLNRFEAFVKREFPGRSAESTLVELSGGEQRFIYLMKFDVTGCNFFILDEPTNFLDLENLRRIYDFLDRTNNPYLIVSHDRHVLTEFCNQIVEILPKGIMVYSGNYDDFIIERETKKNAIERKNYAIKKIVDRLEKSSKWLLQIGGQKDVPSMCRRGHAMELQIERMKRTLREEVKDSSRPDWYFEEVGQSSDRVIGVQNLVKKYGERIVFRNASLEVRAGEKIGLVGYNGAGKSTLLRLITGADKDYQGVLKIGPSTVYGYFAPDGDIFDSNSTIEHIIINSLANANNQTAYNILKAIGIQADPQRQVHTLSGGELSRLQLALIARTKTNLLLLDEPTNHLDLSARESLEESIRAYKGAVIVVSHDSYFLDSVVDSYVLIKDGKFKHIGKLSQEVFLELEAEKSGHK